MDLAKELKLINELAKPRTLNLSNQGLTSIPRIIYKFTELEELNFSNNFIKNVPKSIKKLTKLKKINFANNNFKEIPSILFDLENLEELSFDNYYFVEDEFEEVDNFEFLEYEEQALNEITKIPSELLKLKKLKNLKLDSRFIDSPPQEIIRRGLTAIKNYFEQKKAQGEDYIFEAKLIVVGEPGAGKTTLSNKLIDSNYDLPTPDETTRGIDVSSWKFPIKNFEQQQVTYKSRPNKDYFQVNIWDFGGQEIYHSTHQFFLTKRSLYILVDDAREEKTDFFYWLNIIDLLSDNSPTLILQNQKSNRRKNINEKNLRNRFSCFKSDVYYCNLAKNGDLNELIIEIKHQLLKLPHIGNSLPKEWVNIRNKLTHFSQNYIYLLEYLQLCSSYNLNREQALHLSNYFHDIGVFLHFQDDPLLKNIIILKPDWGTSAVYKVLDDSNLVNESKGKFHVNDLKKIWSKKEYDEVVDELLQLMVRFKICYNIPNSKKYIIPDLLDINQPMYSWDDQSNIITSFRYDFMPKGILTRFIVEYYKYIEDNNLVWKEGVIMEREDTKAEIIEYYNNKEITIKVSGKSKKEFLVLICEKFSEIHINYNRKLLVEQMIPCNCIKCEFDTSPHFFKYKTLRRFYFDSQFKIQCQNSYEMVEVIELIDGVKEKMPKRFFLPAYKIDLENLGLAKKMIENNNFERAFLLIKEILSKGLDIDENAQLEISSLKSRYSSINSDMRNGILSSNNVEFNKIVFSILNLIREMVNKRYITNKES